MLLPIDTVKLFKSQNPRSYFNPFISYFTFYHASLAQETTVYILSQYPQDTFFKDLEDPEITFCLVISLDTTALLQIPRSVLQDVIWMDQNTATQLVGKHLWNVMM